MQRRITSLKFGNSKCPFFIVLGGLSQVTSDQEDESIWKILAVENRPPDIGFGINTQ